MRNLNPALVVDVDIVWIRGRSLHQRLLGEFVNLIVEEAPGFGHRRRIDLTNFVL